MVKAEDKGGLQEALKHGYRRLVAGRKKCRNCGFASPEDVRGEVWCAMFDFRARGGGSCDEWAPESHE